MLKPAIKSFALIVWVGFWYPLALLAKKLHKYEMVDEIVRLCNRGMLKIIGVRLTVTGAPSTKRPLLLVSNHISYLDIFLIGSQITVRFTPKSDIAQWPVISNICRLCDAVFVDRRPGMVKAMNQSLHKVLEDNKVIAIFPEATTGDGIHMQAFKPGAFSLADTPFDDGRSLVIQPVALTYTRIRQLPIDRTQWPDIAWYGDMDLMPHLMNVLAMGPLQAELVFLPPIELAHENDRKELAARCQEVIEQAIQDIRARHTVISPPRPKAEAAPGLKVAES